MYVSVVLVGSALYREGIHACVFYGAAKMHPVRGIFGRQQATFG